MSECEDVDDSPSLPIMVLHPDLPFSVQIAKCNSTGHTIASGKEGFGEVSVKEELHSEDEGEQLRAYRSLYNYTTSAANAAFGEGFVRYGINCETKGLSIMSALGKNWPRPGFVSSGGSKKKKQQQQLEEKLYKCDICREQFAHISSLNVHKQMHKPFTCSQCGKSFTFASNLKQHLRNHAGDLPFVCKVCSKGFMFQCRLEQHETIHVGNKAFECRECGKGFTRKSILKTHEMSHSSLKAFCCLECGKAFTLRSHLNRHAKTHTGEKPFYCNYCSKDFTDKSNFIRHVKRHINTELTNKCQECGAAFADKSYYARHIKKHAKKEELVTLSLANVKNNRNKILPHTFNPLATSFDTAINHNSNIDELERLQPESNLIIDNETETEQDIISDVSVNIARLLKKHAKRKEILALALAKAKINKIEVLPPTTNSLAISFDTAINHNGYVEIIERLQPETTLIVNNETDMEQDVSANSARQNNFETKSCVPTKLPSLPICSARNSFFSLNIESCVNGKQVPRETEDEDDEEEEEERDSSENEGVSKEYSTMPLDMRINPT